MDKSLDFEEPFSNKENARNNAKFRHISYNLSHTLIVSDVKD